MQKWEQPNDTADSPVVGYICLCPGVGNVAATVYLSVDRNARPVEFIHSKAERPDGFTAAIYGPTLQDCMNETAASAIFSKIQCKPDLLLTDEKIFLSALRTPPEIPVVLLEQTEGETTDPSRTIQVGGRSLRFSCNGSETNGLREVLSSFSFDDPLEPFDRARNAFRELSGAAS